MKHISLTILLSVIFGGLSAQKSVDLLAISGRYALPTDYEAPYNNFKAQETGALVNLTLALPSKSPHKVFSSMTYTTFHVNNDAQMQPGVANPIHLHSFIWQIGYYGKFSDGRGLMLLAAPRFMTDFQDASAKNLQMGVMALYEKKYHDDLLLRFGALYHDELGGPYMVPIVHTEWQINSKWSLNGMWPIFGKLNYHVNDNVTTGISHFGLITSYRLGHPDYEGDYIERTSIDLAWFGRVRVFGNVHLEGRVGYALGRSYSQYSSDQKVPFRITIIKFGDDRVAKNTLFNPGVIFNLRLVYNLPL